MAFIKGQPAYFFFEVRDLETGALSEGCTFQSQTVFMDGEEGSLDLTLTEDSGLWKVSIPKLPSDCETLTFRFVPASGLNVHVPLITISLENTPAETVDISGLATSEELADAQLAIESRVSTVHTEVGRIPYNVWNYAMPDSISSSYAGGYLKNTHTTVNSIYSQMPVAETIAAMVWNEKNRTLTSQYISDSVKLVTESKLETVRDQIESRCATASGFATTEEVASAANLILAEFPALADSETLRKVKALLDHWSVSGNVLTTFDDSGNSLSVHALTRDGDGNIISIS